MQKHWLLTAAARAGHAVPESLVLTAGTSLPDAWAAVAQGVGISDEALANAVAGAFHLGVAELDRAESRAVHLVPEKVAREYRILAVRETDREIVVATADPTDQNAEQAAAFAAGRRPVLEVAPPRLLADAIETHFPSDRALESLLGSVDSGGGDVKVVAESGAEVLTADEASAGPVIRLGNLILRDGVKQRASDVHIEGGRGGGAVRFRVDGVMRTHMQLPLWALNRVISRLKVMGGMDIADRLRPQDGRARIRVDGREYDLRLSTVPTREGEKAVIRILRGEVGASLAALNLPPAELARVRSLLGHADGIVLVTGPTGSGKTSTLYAAIRELATGEVNIMTVEDPVEYELPGVTQIQVEVKRSVTFASALRAILRQDPDVILVGEIRDLETAQIAVQAAMTGHLVLGTVHANDAASVVARLADLGLERAAIANTLRGAVAQRLLRRVCRDCVRPAADPLSEDEQRLATRYGMRPVVRAIGCKRCGDTGYLGRLAVLEVLITAPAMLERIAGGGTALEIGRSAVAEGMNPLLRVALDRVRAGETTLQEVERVLGESVPAEAGADDRPHILVVDDDAENRLLARAILEAEGMRVTDAEDGLAALARVTAGETFSLVVLDLNMPRLDGAEVLARLKGSVATAALPVVILTGSQDESAEARLMDAGADDYIRKPIDPPRFLARVKAALRRAGALT